MSDTVLVALIGIISSIATALIAIIPQLNKTKRDTISRLEETDKAIKESISDTNEKIEKLTRDFESYKCDDEDRWAQQIRVRILRFDDELCEQGRQYPSKGSFEQAVKDCDDYKAYLASHPNFHNGIGEISMKHIKDMYAFCLQTSKFGEPKQ